MSRTNWSEARKNLIEEAEYWEENRDKRARFALLYQKEFNRYFGTFDCTFEIDTGKIYGLNSDGSFIPNEDQLQEFANWYFEG